MLNRRALTAIKQSENLATNLARGMQVSPEDVCLLEDRLWSVDPNGYALSAIDRKTVSLQAAVFERMSGAKPEMNGKVRQNVRHIVADTKLDCRRENINTTASTQANTTDLNVKIRSDNRSGISGVCWYKRDEKWQVQLSFTQRPIGLGFYSDLGLAALVAITCREARCWLIAQNLSISFNEVREYLKRVARATVASKDAADYRSLLVINSQIRNDELNHSN